MPRQTRRQVQALVRQMYANLAWLPAYDRRDVLTIKIALDAIVGRQKLKRQTTEQSMEQHAMAIASGVQTAPTPVTHVISMSSRWRS